MTNHVQIEKVIESTHDVPANPPTLEERFKMPDGTLDHLKVQAFQTLEAKGADLTQEEIREAITCVRLLRRTNTGPAATKARGKKKTGELLDLNDLNLEL